MEEKRCSKCERTLPIECFSKNKSTKDGYQAYCKQCCKEYNDKYYKMYNKRYWKEHKEEELKRHSKYVKNRKQLDSEFKLKEQIRALICNSFKRRGKRKESSLKEITGLTAEELRNYLLKTFFDRYGREWDGVESVHIDHIIPISSANTKKDIIELCYYTNLQLLTENDNREKGAKVLT